MGTATASRQHWRDGLRFASGLTDAERAVIEPLLLPPAAAGRPPRRPMREIVDAIFYGLRAGIRWRMPSPCFRLRQTVYGWFAAWLDGGVWRSIVHHRLKQNRELAGRKTSPSAAAIDNQSVKTIKGGAPGGGACSWAGRTPDPRDAGNKVLRRKRDAMVDNDGRPRVLRVHLAPSEDRDGAAPLLAVPFDETCSATTGMECNISISRLPAPIGPTSSCPRTGCKRIALARSGRRLARGETGLDRPWASRPFMCRQ